MFSTEACSLCNPCPEGQKSQLVFEDNHGVH
jgi:hypothetical protein